MSLQVCRQNTPVSINNIRTLTDNWVTDGRCPRFFRHRRRKRAHPPADHDKGAEKRQPKNKQPSFGALPGFVSHFFVATALILGLDRVWVFTAGAGLQDTGKWA